MDWPPVAASAGRVGAAGDVAREGLSSLTSPAVAIAWEEAGAWSRSTGLFETVDVVKSPSVRVVGTEDAGFVLLAVVLDGMLDGRPGGKDVLEKAGKDVVEGIGSRRSLLAGLNEALLVELVEELLWVGMIEEVVELYEDALGFIEEVLKIEELWVVIEVVEADGELSGIEGSD